ncbi:MAG: hypothetical protein KJO50_08360 [Bacteroidia bacterium]|nr:hypothetical protein [Bacteroidia bacterium]
MKYALLISGIVELLGGIVVYFNPEIAFRTESSPITIFKMYGLLAGVIGLINILAYKHYSEARIITIIYISMMFFHAAVGFIVFADRQNFFHQQSIAAVLHLGIFSILFFCYLKDLKPDVNKS